MVTKEEASEIIRQWIADGEWIEDDGTPIPSNHTYAAETHYQVLKIPLRLPSLNEIIESAKGAGGSGAHYVRMKREWGVILANVIRRQRPVPVKDASFKFLWTAKDRRRDPDNIATARKFVFDALVAAGVLPNDTWKVTSQGWEDRFASGSRDGLVLTIFYVP